MNPMHLQIQIRSRSDIRIWIKNKIGPGTLGYINDKSKKDLTIFLRITIVLSWILNIDLSLRITMM
jgi:hypothetical protein